MGLVVSGGVVLVIWLGVVDVVDVDCVWNWCMSYLGVGWLVLVSVW